TRNVAEGALKLLRVLTGAEQGAARDIVCLNAAPLLYVRGMAKNLQEGLDMARAAIDDGRAVAKLRDWVTWQNQKPEDGLPTLDKLMEQA
ncbi:MAG: anthranilate phosphoribosyltransferase, partial [Victivallales bacterium]|nr:anthranilate phosphoribosyltransferase [Victivallales bacterium]